MTRRTRIWLIAAIAFLVVAVLVWFIAAWLGLKGANVWVLRIGLWVLALVASGLVAWFVAPPARRRETDAAEGDDLDTVLKAAESRLAAVKGAKRRLGTMPVIVVLGPAGSTKTTIVAHSGIEADLLAGEVFQQDQQIGPTPVANLWFAHNTALVEAGGKLSSDEEHWQHLVRRLRPRRLAAMFSRRPQAARAAVVCVSCEEFLQSGATEAVTARAREVRALLLDLSRLCGVQLPIYVLFTKADRITYFSEFAQPLSRDEVQRVLGVTLRWPPRTSSGLYGEREFQRLNSAFDRLLAALAAKRLDLLPREADSVRRAGIYEFPRELRKHVPLMVQFLVDLCRPTQLEVSPVLRGAYFTGVRAIVVNDVAPAPTARPAASSGGATQVFDPLRAAGQAEPVAAGSRRRPQWLFLGQLFRDVLLRDRAAQAVARGARPVAGLRRLWLGAAIFLLVLASTWSLVAFARNGDAVAADRALATVGVAETEVPSLETFQRLDALRTHLDRLSRAWTWWPLYNGAALYPKLIPVYRKRLDDLLVGPARLALLHSLDSLPSAPNATAQFSRAYELLKAYLMTTTHTDKLAADFAVPVLLEAWRNGRQIDADRTELARKQLEFYATRLCHVAACAADVDADLVSRTRAFLLKFTGADRVYQLIVSDVSSHLPSVVFPALFANAASSLSDAYTVPGAFTPAGWTLMQEALQHVERFFQADDWVLGEQEHTSFDRAKLADDLRASYVTDYVHRWEAFLAAASLTPFGSAKDAARHLAQLGGNESPLLELLSVVSRNTNVDSLTVGAAFQPVHTVSPPGVTDRFVVDANQPYVTALTGLQTLVAQAADAPPGGADALVAQTMDAARNATGAVTQLTLKFRVDGEAAAVGARVQGLLEEPINGVGRLLGRLPANALNQRGAAFCQDLAPLLRKYPFTPDASTEATLEDLAGVFQPGTGALWRFQSDALANLVVKQGTQWAAKPGAPAQATGAFVRFFNRLAAVSDALWPTGATEPRFDFTLKLLASDVLPVATFTMDGQVSRFTRTFAAAQRYSWVGSTAREVRLSVEVRGREQPVLGYDGPWALFKLLQRATWRSVGSTSLVQWPVTVEGQTSALQAELNLGVARPILKGDYFAGFSCVSQIVP